MRVNRLLGLWYRLLSFFGIDFVRTFSPACPDDFHPHPAHCSPAAGAAQNHRRGCLYCRRCRLRRRPLALLGGPAGRLSLSQVDPLAGCGGRHQVVPGWPATGQV